MARERKTGKAISKSEKKRSYGRLRSSPYLCISLCLSLWFSFNPELRHWITYIDLELNKCLCLGSPANTNMYYDMDLDTGLDSGSPMDNDMDLDNELDTDLDWDLA